MTYHGQVNNGVVVIHDGAGAPLPDGTWVEITPLAHEAGSPAAVRAAMEAEPHLSDEDIAELLRAIATGKPPAASIDPFAADTPEPA